MSTLKSTRLCFKFHFLLAWGPLTSGGPVHARVTRSGMAGDGGRPRLLCPVPTAPRSTQTFLSHLQTLPTLIHPLNWVPQSEAPEVQWDPGTPRRTAVKTVTPPCAGSVLGLPTRPPLASEQPHWGDTQKGSGLHKRPPELISPEQRGTVLDPYSSRGSQSRRGAPPSTAKPLSQEPVEGPPAPHLRCLEYLPRICPEPVHPGVGQLGGDKQEQSPGGGPVWHGDRVRISGPTPDHPPGE